MNKRTAKSAFCAVMSVFALSAKAVTQDIPTPPPSEYADTESQIDVAVTNGPAYGNHIKLWLSTVATPSNNVQIAFGKDTNADGTLAPQEIQLVAGFDCGTWFVRDERTEPGRPLVLEDWTAQLSSNPTNETRMIHLRQVSSVTNRFDLAQVTIRGRGESAAQIALEIFRPGTALLLR